MYPTPLELLNRSAMPVAEALIALVLACTVVLAIAVAALTAVAIVASLVQAWKADRVASTAAGAPAEGIAITR